MTNSDIFVSAAKEVVNAFHLVLKNRGIYPVDHSICKKSAESFAQVLFGFLSTYGSLKLDVNKEFLSIGDDVVYQSPDEKRDLPFILFRDGIQWLEFQEGFQVTHLPQFIEIFDKYRELAPETEEDLVTALWEANLPNLRYKAVDVYWQNEPALDISSLPLGCDENDQAAMSDPAPANQVPLMVETESQPLCQLTPEEITELKDLIQEDELRDPTQDLVDIFTVFSSDQAKYKDLETVLAFLADEVHESLQSDQFPLAFKLLRHLHNSREMLQAEKTWAVPFVDAFFDKLANPDTLKSVADMWLWSNLVDEKRLDVLKNFLLFFPPKAILAIGPVLPLVRLPKAQECLMEILQIWAQKDIAPLETLLADSEAAVVERLVNVLGRLEGDRPKAILAEMVHHKSASVRRQALRQLLAQDPNQAFEFFYLIEDSHDAVRQVILGCLGQARNTKFEKRLVNYLQKQDLKIDTEEHLLACYRVLGRCGSNQSLSFLDRQLFSQGWLSTPLKSTHRRGALLALSGIGTEEAKEQLQRAAKSLKPGIRNAYRKVMEKKR